MQTYRPAAWSTAAALLCILSTPHLAHAALAPAPGFAAAQLTEAHKAAPQPLASLFHRRHSVAPSQANGSAPGANAQRTKRSVPTSVVSSTPPAPGTVQAAVPAGADEAVESVDTTDVVAVSADGQVQGSDTSTWYGDAWPQFDRVIDAYTARTSRKHTFNTLIAHRNSGGFAKAPFDTLFGFDAGSLKVGLGLRFGILDDLDIGVFRMNGTFEVFDTYDFDVRYQFLKQARFGVDMALRVGISWFPVPASIKALKQAPYNADSSGPFVSLLIDRVVANRVLVGLGILYHQNSSGPAKTSQDSGATVALQLATDVRLSEGFSLALEYTQPIAGYHQFNPDITFGPRFITNRHTFAIVLSNTQWFDAAGIITGNDRTTFNRWVLGFNITREL